jgi:hypothetical protein
MVANDESPQWLTGHWPVVNMVANDESPQWLRVAVWSTLIGCLALWIIVVTPDVERTYTLVRSDTYVRVRDGQRVDLFSGQYSAAGENNDRVTREFTHKCPLEITETVNDVASFLTGVIVVCFAVTFSSLCSHFNVCTEW